MVELSSCLLFSCSSAFSRCSPSSSPSFPCGVSKQIIWHCSQWLSLKISLQERCVMQLCQGRKGSPADIGQVATSAGQCTPHCTPSPAFPASERMRCFCFSILSDLWYQLYQSCLYVMCVIFYQSCMHFCAVLCQKLKKQKVCPNYPRVQLWHFKFSSCLASSKGRKLLNLETRNTLACFSSGLDCSACG